MKVATLIIFKKTLKWFFIFIGFDTNLNEMKIVKPMLF